MKWIFPLFILLIGATYIDQLDADFQLGTTNSTNVTNNSVILSTFNSTYNLSGTFHSRILDLGSNPVNRTIGWSNSAPAGTSLLVSSRSGPTSTPDGSWSTYSASYSNTTASNIANPIYRYFQYRLLLATTNSTFTPTINSVTVTYDESGPNITAATSVNADLDEEDSGSYNFSVNISDTISLVNVWGRYRIGNDSYSSYQNITANSQGYYSILVPMPAGNWTTRSNELVYVNIYASNSNTSSNQTFTELNDEINNPPVLGSLGNTTIVERVAITYGVSATDVDGDTLTFTSTQGTMVSLTNTTAELRWTPQDPYTGIVPVVITVSDGQATDQATVYFNVTPTNDPPVMAAVTSQSGYFGDRIIFEISVTDSDFNENHTYWVDPPVFDVDEINITTSNTTYGAIANFSALTDHEGFTELIFYVTDGEYTDSQNATLTIDYCGDMICQSTYESETTCAEDCNPPLTPTYVALSIPPRICVNETANITTYNASSRFVCAYENRAYEQGGYCEPIDDVEINVFSLSGALHSELSGITSTAGGRAVFTPTQVTRYKLIATKEDHISATAIITAQACDDDIETEKLVITAQRPQLTVEEEAPIDIPPREEQPEIIEEETNIVVIVIWYAILPLLLASLVYVGSVWYQIHRDTNPILLEMRIFLFEQMQKIEPTLRPIRQKIRSWLHPVISPIWRFMKPYWDKFNAMLRGLVRR